MNDWPQTQEGEQTQTGAHLGLSGLSASSLSFTHLDQDGKAAFKGLNAQAELPTPVFDNDLGLEAIAESFHIQTFVAQPPAAPALAAPARLPLSAVNLHDFNLKIALYQQLAKP